MDRIEMPIELERAAGVAAVEPHHDCRRCRMSAVGSLDAEAVRLQQLGEPVARGAGFACFARNFDEAKRGLDKARPVDRRSNAFAERLHGPPIVTEADVARYPRLAGTAVTWTCRSASPAARRTFSLRSCFFAFLRAGTAS